MKRYVIAAITCIALTVGASPAAASGGLGGVVQTLTGTSQQTTNTAGNASSFNGNATSQSNDQSQAGLGGTASTGDATAGGAGCCRSGAATSGDAYGGDVDQSQSAANTNSTSQEASAASKAVQVLPIDVAVPVCVAKACSAGPIDQSNGNASGDASATNVNVTDQSNGQWQQGAGGDASTGDATAGGSGDAASGNAHGGDVTQSQTASNANETRQDASATSRAVQLVPVNVAVPVCVAKGCTGGVRQSNDNRSGDAAAFNGNGTSQSNAQGQSGFGGDASTGDATTGGAGCCGSGDATSGDSSGGDVDQAQSASNANVTSQQASARSTAVQVLPANVAVPVCVAWHCTTGDVEQSNTNGSGDAWAGNLNGTRQANGQSQKAAGGDAATGDATASGGCCSAPDPKPGHGCDKAEPKHPKPLHGCDKAEPKHPKRGHGCDKAEPKHPKPPHGQGGDARSGDAHGGDVHQSQSASNDNRTDQAASAASTAAQEGSPSLFALPCARAPRACRPC